MVLQDLDMESLMANHQPGFDGQEQTLVPGRLRGYRWFNFQPHSRLKIGSSRQPDSSGRWPMAWQAEMTARCYPNTGLSGWYPIRSCAAPNPHEDHGCGLWGYYQPDLMGGVGGLTANPAMGVIEAWGRVLLGACGFRAQYARVIAINYTWPIDGWIKRACRQSGIECYWLSRQTLCDDFPVDDVSSLIGFTPKTAEQVQSEQMRRELDEKIGQLIKEQEATANWYEARGDTEYAAKLRAHIAKLQDIMEGR